MKKFVLYALVFSAPLFAQSSFKEANYTLHLLHENIRANSEALSCDEKDWPDTLECNTYARVVAKSMRAIDIKIQGGR